MTIIDSDSLPMLIVAELEDGVRIACTTSTQLAEVFKKHGDCKLHFYKERNDGTRHDFK